MKSYQRIGFILGVAVALIFMASVVSADDERERETLRGLKGVMLNISDIPTEIEKGGFDTGFSLIL